MSSSIANVTDREVDDMRLFFLLGLSFQLVLGEVVRRLDVAGYEDLRPVHGLVFQALLGGCTTSTEIGERIGVTKQAAGQMIDFLESAGYVERREHPDGGRRRLIALTKRGSVHVGVAGHVLSTLENELAVEIDDPGLVRLRAALIDLIGHFAEDALPPLRPVW